MNTKTFVLLAAISTAAFPVLAQDDVVRARVINALPESQGITLSVGGTELFSGVQSNQITPFKPVPKQEDQKLTIQNGTQQLQTTRELSFDDDDENYTILVTPDENSNTPKVVILDDDAEDVDQDEVELIVINAAPEHKSIKLKLNDETKERGINYADSSDDDVKPGVYNLSLINATGTDTVIATKSVTLVGGTAVTVLLTSPNIVKIVNNQTPDQDLTAGGNAQAIDRPTTGSATMGATTGTTNRALPPGAATQAPSTMTTPAMSM